MNLHVLVLTIRYILCIASGMICTTLGFILLSIYNVDNTSSYLTISLMFVLFICSGLLARIIYSPHFIVRHLVAIYYLLSSDLAEVTHIGSQISFGMNKLYYECNSSKEFYIFILELYDKYHEQELKKKVKYLRRVH